VTPRLRFAPSPTGHLHVGGARTALFNWLYCRRQGGTFILRIEDTDAERSSEDMSAAILSGLRWLGLDWDEGPEVGGPHAPYFQSRRLDRHVAAARRLVASGRAYSCYCTPEELGARRQAAGPDWRYDRRCRNLDPAEIRRRDEAGAPKAIRFAVPEGRTSFEDLVRGPITVDHRTIEDFVIVRSDGLPTFHLSVVADDIDMAITHVVRGDDHVSNTPKHILLYAALESPAPVFAHVPLILGTDRKRLSKRHGATSVAEYEAQGYLPDAMVNFLALLGWSPGDDREVMTRDELIAAFDLTGISGGSPIFNPEKLDWFNQQHLQRLSPDTILRRLEPDLRAAALDVGEPGSARHRHAERAVDLVKPRAKKLVDLVPQLRPFLDDRITRDAAAVAKHLSAPDLAGPLEAWRDRVATVEPFEPAALESALREVAAARDIKAGVLIHATRVAVTGQAVSPGLFEVLELVGRERVLARLDEVIAGVRARA